MRTICALPPLKQMRVGQLPEERTVWVFLPSTQGVRHQDRAFLGRPLLVAVDSGLCQVCGRVSCRLRQCDEACFRIRLLSDVPSVGMGQEGLGAAGVTPSLDEKPSLSV